MHKPNLFIAGVPKGGSTALAALLSQHPDIFIPPKKEPRYYLFRGKQPDPNDPTHVDTCYTLEKYLELYKNASSYKYRLDATPAYLFYDEALKAIQQDNHSAKIIILLRDPVERAFSHFLFAKLQGYEPKEAAIEDIFEQKFVDLKNGFRRERPYLTYSTYSQPILSLFSIFEKKQILILSSESLQNDPNGTLQKIISFLEIKSYNFNLSIGEKAKSGEIKNGLMRTIFNLLLKFRKIIPKSGFRKGLGNYWGKMRNKAIEKPKLDESTRNRLIEYFKRDVAKLKENVGLGFNDWKNFQN